LKVKGQGHKGQKMAFFGPLMACMQFMFGKTSLASSSDLRFSAINYDNCIYAFSVVQYSIDWATGMASEPQKNPIQTIQATAKSFSLEDLCGPSIMWAGKFRETEREFTRV